MTIMLDLLDRLRAKRSVDGSGVMCELPELVVDCAIEEIERLRAMIAQLRQVVGAVSVEGHSYADIRKDIRDAKIIG